MRSKRRLILLVTAFTVVFGFLTIASSLCAASNENVLHSFCSATGCKDGALPSGGLIFDAAGNLYGTTSAGGATRSRCTGSGTNGCGIVFRLAPGNKGRWTETVLYEFNGTDGSGPGGNLIFDAAGNLYGTTAVGGASGAGCGGYGCGTVFQLTPRAQGKWTETVLYSFNGADGVGPNGNLIFDATGNLYGTTVSGGASGTGCGGYGCGTVFQLAPEAGGAWTETVLYSLCSAGECSDGSGPNGGLIFDATGKLYGTTVSGGGYSTGTVFQLASGAGGTWSEKVLSQFQHHYNGNYPSSGLIFDAAGNLYGTTGAGGAHCYVGRDGCGTVFELKPHSNGTWKETVLYSFDRTPDGSYPSGA